MTQPGRILSFTFLAAALVFLAERAAAQDEPPATSGPQGAVKVRLADAYGRLPLSFEAAHAVSKARQIRRR